MSVMVHRAQGERQDRRARRTRSAIVTAFNRLFLERGYASLTSGDVAAAADVGRSTFYDHFRSMDDLLAETLAPVLAPLAEGCFEPHQQEAARRAVEHIWENRRHARILLGDVVHAIVLRSFTAQIGAALQRVLHRTGAKPALDPELISLQLATGQLAVLGAWMSGRSGHTAHEVANALHASGRASVLALMGSTEAAG